MAAASGLAPFSAPATTASHPVAKAPANATLDNGTATMRLAAAQAPSSHLPPNSKTLSLPADLIPPGAFDARDVRAGQVPCKAFQALNQGSCGACYAFASATAFSARLCAADPASSVRNVVISPQSLIDCTPGGCTGGSVHSTLALLASRPAVELWCDPYTGGQKACGSTCGTSNAYRAVPGSVQQVGGAGAAGVVQMQLELLRNGPGVVGFTIMNDLFAYSSGVYSPSASATVAGRHAVSLVGWGQDHGVPYWICQSSWGADWGEGGFLRIVRGADACGIESITGLVVATPLLEPVCPAAACSTVATTLRDCSCRCPLGRAGPKCERCALTCRNGGVSADACTRCECPMGTWGGDPQCAAGFRLSSLASCGQDPPARIAVTYTFTANAPPPPQTSYVGVYPLGETRPFSYVTSAAICAATSSSYNPGINGGLCPMQGAFQMARPTAPGQYKVVVVPFSPPDARGLQGFYPLKDENIIGLYTVLPDGCSDASRAAAKRTNSPATLLAQRLAAASADRAAQLAAMEARLDAAQPLLAALAAVEVR